MDDDGYDVDPATGEVLSGASAGAAAHRLAQLEQTVGSLHTAIESILDHADDETSRSAPRPSRWSWRDAAPEAQSGMWEDLREFTDWLITRYTPRGSHTIPPCWYRHPVGVEELWALLAAWQSAYYDGDRAHERMTIWHGSYLWPTLERLPQVSGWSSCGSLHKPAPTTPRTTDDGFDDHTIQLAPTNGGPPSGTGPLTKPQTASSRRTPVSRELGGR